ncbi:MAG: sensor histidine kinase KdpD [Magnetococcales bacterium]|nr:sensor histidine kinase KdpD [Magnetococcales bacterium]
MTEAADWADSSPVQERILVCVSPSPASESLIHAAHRLASQLQAPWLAITVDAPDAYAMTANDRQRLLGHLRLADSLGAETVGLTGQRVSQEVIRFARERQVSRILIGKPTLKRWRDHFRPSLVHELIRDSGPIHVEFVASPLTTSHFTPPPKAVDRPWGDYWVAFAMVFLTTCLTYIGRTLLSAPDLVMLYLLPIMGISFRYGQGPSLLASSLSVAAYDFFFVHPYFTFSVSDSKYIITFTILFVVGLVVSNLMTRIRQQAEEAKEREQQTDALHRLGREVLSTLKDSQVACIITNHAVRTFGGEAALYLTHGQEQWSKAAATPESFQLSEEEMTSLVIPREQEQTGLRDSLMRGEGQTICLPIVASRVRGILALRLTQKGVSLAGHYPFFMEAFARQASLAMDRARLGEEVQAAAIRAKSDELRGTLLSMASHDLRTPLAAITGAGTALRDTENPLDSLQQRELLETICLEAERMERLVSNLLDMVRLESGGCQLRKEWIPFEEMAGSAITRLEKRCQGRQVTVEVDEQAPLLYVDPVFFEQVLVNLLDNALKYTPEDSTIAWRVEAHGSQVAIIIMDEGEGIAPELAERIFEKFTRGESLGVPGSGLGLAICRGVVQAHGGTIQAVTRQQGGGIFQIWLPQPPLPADILSSSPEEFTP